MSIMRTGVAIPVILFGAMLLTSCGKPEESITKVANGRFKVLIRSQGFHHSAIRNVDVCVVETSDRRFPKDKAQCFLHGFDFSGLTVKWRSPNEIEVSFRTGRVTRFTNYASVSTDGSLPVEFHTTLCDGVWNGAVVACETSS
jgi:hypothetical protein